MKTREEKIRFVAALLDGKKLGQRFSYVRSKSKQAASQMTDAELDKKLKR